MLGSHDNVMEQIDKGWGVDFNSYCEFMKVSSAFSSREIVPPLLDNYVGGKL